MAKRKRKRKSSEEIGNENEFMKLKMMAEFGGNFMGSENIPPEVENQFLKQIISFHKQHENSKLTTVYKFIGEPEYNHVHDLTDKEVEKELKKLLRIMGKHGIALNVLAETPATEIYRFITEELFKHEIEDVKVKGWVNQFIYEEFHPNPEYEVKSAVNDCLQYIFNKGHAFFEEHFSEDMLDAIGLLTDTEDFKEKVEIFWQQNYNVKLKNFEITHLKIDHNKNTATVGCKVNYSVQREKGKRYKTENTHADFVLEQSKYLNGWWEIKQVICEALK
jgi:hypothetical protein